MLLVASHGFAPVANDGAVEGFIMAGEPADQIVKTAEKLGVDMPICEAIADILSGKISVDEAIIRLLSRDRKLEIG